MPDQADVDQVTAYARDLIDYHEASHNLDAYRILVVGGAVPGYAAIYDDVVITAPEGLSRYLLELDDGSTVDLGAWLRARYDPLPTLVEAARRIFAHEPLPHIRHALSAGVDDTVALLGHLLEQAASGEERRLLAFVTGVPGAGKTLVGLRLVYERSEASGRAIFLSGNKPLVEVLRDALRSGVYVHDLHAFIKTYDVNRTVKVPNEHVLVFDEAQRAWDRQYQRHKRNVDASEPELLVQIGERIPDWSALVGLVGEGQEIHSGEEAGIEQWRAAVTPPNAAESWIVHCPPKLSGLFAGLPVRTHERLDLPVSLRSRRAQHLHDWVQRLLTGSIALAARRAVAIAAADYPMWVTRDLEEARAYARARYEGMETKRYGLVASSHARCLRRFGVDNGFMATSRMSTARWFNAPPEDPRSCCDLSQPVTEFGCQGLELDLPIVCWGEDAQWHGDSWQLNAIRRRYPLQDPDQVLINTYRVLLTRGRDGVVIWLPPLAELDETERTLLAAGVRPLLAESELAEQLMA